MKKVKAMKGFTLVEIMIVVAIIGLLVAIAIPNFLRARTEARADACVANLKQIESAKERWAMSTGAEGTDTPLETDIIPDFLKAPPTCPAGGTYAYGTINTVPTCGIGTNDTADTYDDHVLPYASY